MRKSPRQKVDPAMTKLEVGTPVIVRKDDGSEVPTNVSIKPWQLSYGAWVIGLDGISGGYDLQRVRLA